MGTSANVIIMDKGKELMTKNVHFDGYKEFTGSRILEFIILYKDKLDIFKNIEIREFDEALYDKIMEHYFELQMRRDNNKEYNVYSSMLSMAKANKYLSNAISSPLMKPGETVCEFFNYVVSAEPRYLDDFKESSMYGDFTYKIDIGNKTFQVNDETPIDFEDITLYNVKLFNTMGYEIGRASHLFPFFDICNYTEKELNL